MSTDAPAAPESPRILIVDDTPPNLELLSGMLYSRGYEPRPVLSGRQALAAARAEPPDLVLLDIKMPEMDGFEVCARLKAEKSLQDIPVIFITALTEVADKVKGFSLGAVDFVTKPFQAEEIQARIDTHLRIRMLQRRLQDQNRNLERLVAERTSQLEAVHDRLQEWSGLTDDFLNMISHEIRTPTNGVLAMGEMLLDLCPPSPERSTFGYHFRLSSLRLRHLIEDSLLIAGFEKAVQSGGTQVAFSFVLDQVRDSMEEIQIRMEPDPARRTFVLQGDGRLLQKALEDCIRLGMAFSREKKSVNIRSQAENNLLCLRISLDDLSVSEQQLDQIFQMESPMRLATAAESLGLAPVIARKIISFFGGELRLVKAGEESGYLEAVLQGAVRR